MLRPQFVRAQVQILPVSTTLPFFFFFFVAVAVAFPVAVARVRRCGQRRSKARRRDERRRCDARLFFSRNGTIGAPIQGRLGFTAERFVVVRFRFEKDLASRTLTLKIEDVRKSAPTHSPSRFVSADVGQSRARQARSRTPPFPPRRPVLAITTLPLGGCARTQTTQACENVRRRAISSRRHSPDGARASRRAA